MTRPPDKNCWEKRPEIKKLAEQLRGFIDTGAVLIVDSNSFSINVSAVYDLPDEDRDAPEGSSAHRSTLDDALERLDIPEIEGADTVYDLIAALGLLLGFGSESV